MAHGLRVNGSHLGVQIDQDYRNLMRIASGSTGANLGGNLASISLPSQGGLVPQVFVRPWSNGDYVGGLQWDDYTCQTGRIYTTGGFEWVAFGVYSPQAIDGGTYGLRVLDGSGNVAIDTRYEASRIQSTILIGPQPNDGFGGTGYPQNYGFSGWGLRPWIGLNNFPRAYVSDDVSGQEYAYMLTLVDTNTIQLRLAAVVTGSPSGGGTINGWVDVIGGNSLAFPGRYVDVPVLRRYTD